MPEITTTTAAPSGGGGGGGGCFPSGVKVSLRNGKSVTMDELQVGDEVLTGKGVMNVFFL